MRSDTTETPWLDLASPAFSTRSAEVREARAARWCARTPYGLAVLRHRETGLLLRDRRLRQGSHAWPALHAMEGSFADFWRRSVISREGDPHRRLRTLATSSLTPAFIEGLVPAFDRIAADLAGNLHGRDTCEFMEEFSIPFAGQAIAALLGMAPSDWPAISRDASDLGLAMGVECKRHEPTVNAACDRLTDLARDLVARVRSGRDRDSYVARLAAAADADPTLGPRDILDMVVISIFGGVDTTRSQLGLGMALFAEHPDQWALLRNRPDLVPAAIEETIRARPTTTWVTREALEDFEFEGERIGAGTTVHLLVHASARDPAVSPDDRFDIAAERRIHFGFGGGAHHCLGHLVARTDMAAALRALLRTLESFTVGEDAEWLPDSGNTSPVRLPLAYRLA